VCQRVAQAHLRSRPGPLLDHGGAEREEHPRHGVGAAQEELRQVKMEASLQCDSSQQAAQESGAE